MANVTIVGNVITITSQYTLEQLRLLERYRPAVLRLYDEEDAKDHEVFRVGTAEATASVGQFGITFCDVSAAGKATLSAQIPHDVEDKVKFAVETLGPVITNIKKVERQISPALEQVQRELTELRESIVVM